MDVCFFIFLTGHYVNMKERGLTSDWPKASCFTSQAAARAFSLCNTHTAFLWAGMAESVQWLATGWMVRESNPSGGRDFPPVQTGPGAHQDYCTVGTGSFPGGKASGMWLYHPPHLAPRLKKELSYSSTPRLWFHGLFWVELYFTFTFHTQY